ncbi:MAG TPA: SpoIIE family protein phosphatase [Thermomonospora sp.]|nr:SpoIIE family protein phosphatase [Thermomonospora sp.]
MEGNDDAAALRDLYEHSPCGLLSTLPDGTIVKVNATLLTWTGHTRAGLLGGTRFQELLAVGDRIFYETHYAPLVTMQGAVAEIAVDLVCAGGDRLPVLLSSVLRHPPDGGPDMVLTCVFRATDRRAYERELLLARQRAQESERRARVLAETLQRSLLPPALPPVPGLDVADAYRPAGHGDEVGGDFYDLFETAPGEWGLVLGDVCGKGAEAAVVTSLARYTVRAVATESERPSGVLRRLNTALVRQRTERFLTAVYARLRRESGGSFQLTVSLGGHPAPLHASADGRVRKIGREGDLLGILDEVSVSDSTVTLLPGDAVLFFTDGVEEARSEREFFDEHRLTELLAASGDLTARGVADRLLHRVLAFQDDLPRDDIALIVLKR